MSDIQNPPPPSGPPAVPPVPPPAAPPQGRGPRFVVGVVLTVLGGLFALVALPRLGLVSTGNVAESLGRLTGTLLIPAVLLTIGIVLLVTSRRR